MKRTRILTIAALLVIAAGCPLTLSDFSVEDVDGGEVDGSAADARGNGDGNAGPDAAKDAGGVVDGACPSLCVPPLPAGWTFASYDQARDAGCATSYGTPTDVQEGPSAAAATCGCTCTATQPTCDSLVVTAGKNGACNNISSQTVGSNGACDVLGSTITTTNFSKMSVTVTPDDGGCTPDASVVTPSVTFASQGRVCDLVGAPGGGCGSGVCVPDPSPAVMCVRQSADAGVLPCPAGYPVQHVVGTTMDDTRGCSPCTCGYDAGACGGNVTFSNNGSCGNILQVVAANGLCQAVTSHTWQSFTYAATQTPAACAPSVVTPTGDAGFAAPATVCCTK